MESEVQYASRKYTCFSLQPEVQGGSLAKLLGYGWSHADPSGSGGFHELIARVEHCEQLSSEQRGPGEVPEQLAQVMKEHDIEADGEAICEALCS